MGTALCAAPVQPSYTALKWPFACNLLPRTTSPGPKGIVASQFCVQSVRRASPCLCGFVAWPCLALQTAGLGTLGRHAHLNCAPACPVVHPSSSAEWAAFARGVPKPRPPFPLQCGPHAPSAASTGAGGHMVFLVVRVLLRGCAAGLEWSTRGIQGGGSLSFVMSPCPPIKSTSRWA